MEQTEKQKQAQEMFDKLPEDVKKTYSMDNEGNLVYKNRAYRRKKPPTDNWFTKKTHAIQLKRAKLRKKQEKEERKEKREQKSLHNRGPA